MMGNVMGVMMAAPGFANGLGFTPGGIVRGSPAASMMRQHGGAVPKGSLVSTLQSLGATGSVYRAAGAFAGTSKKNRKTGL